MRVLLLEDQPEKMGAVASVVREALRDGDVLSVVCTAHEVRCAMRSAVFDVVVLDLVVPLRVGDEPRASSGVDLAREVLGRSAARRPLCTIIVSAVAEALREIEPVLNGHPDAVCLSAEANRTSWRRELRQFVGIARCIWARKVGVVHSVDVALFCALADPELVAVRRLPIEWAEPRTVRGLAMLDGVLLVDGVDRRVVAFSARRMGATATAVSLGQFFASETPRVIGMCGIAAALSDEVNIGDVVVADPAWEWMTGKVAEEEGEPPRLLPAPVQEVASSRVVAAARSDAVQRAVEAAGAAWRGEHPGGTPRVLVGPMASSPAVIAAKSVHGAVREQQGKVLALEMEGFAFLNAARECGGGVSECFVAKAVTDRADAEKSKSNAFQPYGAAMSATAALEIAVQLLRASEA